MTDGPVVAVGAVVIHDGALLMVRRGREPGKGLWSIPGGRVEKHETLAGALAREVREETGLEIEVADLLGILEVTGDPHYVILDHVATVVGAATPRAGDDADEVRWVPLDEVENLDCTPRFVESLRGWGVL
ncbi:MAG TPA: NUDIX domain-containing protein [Actinomycetota bacterium]|nr:NUDIX domain-containing protein [Actinomycetota bacterium]